jgi:carbamoyl-phosphate synthase large subunit
VVVQFGGQTPLKLAAGLHRAGVPILGTSIEAIDLAEDRSRFGELLGQLGYKAPPFATAASAEEALQRAPAVGFPLLVRPSYVLGGRAMEIVYSTEGLRDYLQRVGSHSRGRIYLDRFLEDAIEVDVDALCDGEDVWVAGIMQHVEEAGIHSGDSACVLPPHTLGEEMVARIREQTEGIARGLGVVGLLNVQFAIHGDDGLHVLEANPRASRTVPFVSKAIGVPLAKLACRILLGERMAELELDEWRRRADSGNGHVCVKEAVLPFNRFAGADTLLGPEMRSTGEVMGVSERFSIAFAKSQLAAGILLPKEGRIFISVASKSAKEHMVDLAARLVAMGYQLMATEGTARRIEQAGIPVEHVKKLQEGHPNLIDHLIDGRVQLIMNTPRGKGARTDEGRIRAASVTHGVPCITTIPAADACVKAMEALREEEMTVQALQDRFVRVEPTLQDSGSR